MKKESHGAAQARECENSTDPDPQNMFWWFFQTYIYICNICYHNGGDIFEPIWLIFGK